MPSLIWTKRVKDCVKNNTTGDSFYANKYIPKELINANKLLCNWYQIASTTDILDCFYMDR